MYDTVIRSAAMGIHKVKTGYRPIERDDGSWGLDHDKDFYRDLYADLSFGTREQAEEWIAGHLKRLERVAEQRFG